MGFTPAPIGTFQKIQDAIIDKLTADAVLYNNISPYLNYTVVSDRFIPLQEPRTIYPVVVVWIQDIIPNEQNAGYLYQQENSRVLVDMIAKGVMGQTLPPQITPKNADPLPDQVAWARLKYLIQQVKQSIYDLVNADFGLEMGDLSSKKWPRFQMIPQNLEEPQDSIIGGRWYVDAEYGYEPVESRDSADLEEIRIDATKYKAYYDYTS